MDVLVPVSLQSAGFAAKGFGSAQLRLALVSSIRGLRLMIIV